MNIEEYLEHEKQKELDVFRRNRERYERMSPEERKRQATKSLIASGVLNEDGTAKSEIITR